VTDETKELDFESFRVRPEVLETVAGLAAGSVDGVASLVGGGLGKKASARGISVAVEESSLSVDAHLSVRFGVPMKSLAQAVQKSVSDALYNTTGWPVSRVEVFVDDVVFDEQD